MAAFSAACNLSSLPGAGAGAGGNTFTGGGSFPDDTTQASGGTIAGSGPLNTNQAMRKLYPTYDTELKRARWNPSQTELGKFNFYANIKTVNSTPVLTKQFQQGGAERAFVITKTLPPESECQDCVPVLGGALFSKTASGWKLDGQNRSITRTGATGQLSPGKLVKIGADKFAIQFHWTATNQGITEEGDLLIAEVQGELREIFSMITGGNNRRYCEDNNMYDDNPNCWSYRSTLEFPRDSGSAYYELRLSTIGDKPVDDNQIVNARDSRRFYFADGAYRPESER
jgi:hypothetical protein